tara:strand:+ start:7664 stop:8353 length:690 start_codon:yes stop_codon:yes gene_type:complete
MILLSNEFDSRLISIKKKLKYTNNFSFVPIKYNKTDLVIQTPKLYTKYGFNNNRYNTIQLYFKNIENDKSLEDLLKLFDDIYLKINNKYKGNNFMKDDNELKYFNLRISDNSIFFDERRNRIKNINSNTYGNYIICLHGIWIRDNIISYQWNLLQAKINLPLHLSIYSFIDDTTKKIPPPPPLPPRSIPSSFKLNKPKNKKKFKEKKTSFTPSIDEINKILSRLKKIKI